jgi:hypothetical protein
VTQTIGNSFHTLPILKFLMLTLIILQLNNSKSACGKKKLSRDENLESRSMSCEPVKATGGSMTDVAASATEAGATSKIIEGNGGCTVQGTV